MTPSRSPNSSLRNSVEPQPPQPSPLKISPHLQRLGQIGWQQTQKLGTYGLRRFQRIGLHKPLIFGGLLIALITLRPQLLPSWNPNWTRSDSPYPPLAMQGGDPYIRALMRTISASESNDPNPYQLLYGGTYFSDLSNHPDQCIPITNGPNQGNCSTAAGRYQFITSTWDEKAQRYHPQPEGWLLWQHYPFDPINQDRVVYNWLSDPEAWGVDIAALLRNNQLDEVLYRLSGTWTSLGYGIETNTMTPHLDEMYQTFLQDEQSQSQQSQQSQRPLQDAASSTLTVSTNTQRKTAGY